MDADTFEMESVHSVYEDISLMFSHTRNKPWPFVMSFLDSLPQRSVVADVGCGNGRYLSGHANVWPIGCDRSESLLSSCSTSGAELVVGDNLNLPYRDCFFDAAISIAVIHHFSSLDRRKRAILEILRVVRRGGRVLIFVWSLEQGNKKSITYTNQDVLVPWHLQKKFRKNTKADVDDAPTTALGQSGLPVPNAIATTLADGTKVFYAPEGAGSGREKRHKGRLCLQEDVPEVVRNGGKVLQRYYHLFEKGELESICPSAAVVVDSGFHCDNHYVVLEKLP